MTERTAIRPLVEPGEYPCVWLLPGSEGETVRVHGFLTLEGGRPVRGQALGPEVPMDGDDFPQRARYPVIRCELRTGQVATLVDATVSTWFIERAHITSTVAVVGMTAPATATAAVCSAEVQVTNLDAITGTAPLDRAILFSSEPGVQNTYRATASPDARIEWDDATTSAAFDYSSASRAADNFRVDQRFSPNLTIDLDEPLPIVEFCSRWIDPLRWLVALATGRKQSVTVLTATGEDEAHQDGRWAVYASGITQEPYNSSEESVREAGSALALGRDGDSLLDLINSWMRLSDAFHPAIHTFARQITAIDQAAPPAAFQVLIQTIEGVYRAQNIEAAATAAEKHVKKRDEVLAILTAADAPSRLRKYARRSIGTYPPSSLNDALHWLDSVTVGSFADAIEPLALIQAQMEAGDTWADGLRKTRNDLAHGNKSFDPREVHDVAKVLMRYCTSVVIQLLGGSTAAQERALLAPD